MHLEPAKSIIAKMGGPEAVARITGKSVSRVYRWMYDASRGGTNGEIPKLVARQLLEHARENGIALTADDFFKSSAVTSASGDSSPDEAAA